VGEALRSFMTRSGMLQELEDRRILLEWEDLVGPTLASDAWPLRIEKGVLWIGVNNAPQANHLLYLKPRLLDRIRELFPTSRIRDIRVQRSPGRERAT
jgi:hypothetical protein